MDVRKGPAQGDEVIVAGNGFVMAVVSPNTRRVLAGNTAYMPGDEFEMQNADQPGEGERWAKIVDSRVVRHDEHNFRLELELRFMHVDETGRF